MSEDELTCAQVTTIIPYDENHTPKKMLNEAIESVLSQNIKTNIYIVTNDDILIDNVNIIPEGECSGPAQARNIGINLTDNRFVAFLDADDLWHENKLKKQLHELNKTGAGLCVEGRGSTKEKFIENMVKNSGAERHHTSSIIIDTNEVSTMFNETMHRYEDHLFMIEAAAEGGVCFCEDVITVRKHSSGLSGSAPYLKYKSKKKMVDILETEIPEAKDHLPYLKGRMNYSKSRHYHSEREYLKSIEPAIYAFIKLRSVKSLIIVFVSIGGTILTQLKKE